MTTFNDWLVSKQYSGSTLRATLREAKQIEQLVLHHQPVRMTLTPTIRRMEAYGEEIGAPSYSALAQSARRLLPNAGVQTRFGGRASKRKVEEKRAVDDDDWSRLDSHVVADASLPARVVLVMMRTGMRVSDVLRIPIQTLYRGIERGRIPTILKGGKPFEVLVEGAGGAWELLGEAVREARPSGLLIAHAVSPRTKVTEVEGATGAYQAVRRVLQKHAAAAGVDSRIYTHRLRRTVGVRAYRVTEDVLAVRDLLGHSKSRTTEGYLSEARPDRVADLQKKIREDL
jgi:integrase